ncbi:MAG: hypothetical protein QNJ14_04025 [Woeseiaceae bacterium]|nr:hypothetical protein [Woeseiaceae bacterium]
MIDNAFLDTELDSLYERNDIEFDAIVEPMHAPVALAEATLAFADFRDAQHSEWR